MSTLSWQDRLISAKATQPEHQATRLTVMPTAKSGRIRFAMLSENLNWHDWSYWCQKAAEGTFSFLLEAVASVLMTPVQFLKVIGAGRWYAVEKQQRQNAFLAAFLGVVLISVLLGASKFLWSASGITVFNWIQVVMTTAAGLLSWLLIAIIIAGLGFAFKGEFRLYKLLISTGFAPVPWLFLIPVQLLQWSIVDFMPGLAASMTIINLLLWVWTVTLFILGVKYSLDLTLGRVLILLGAPFILGIVAIAWIAGFFGTLVTLTQFSHF